MPSESRCRLQVLVVLVENSPRRIHHLVLFFQEILRSLKILDAHSRAALSGGPQDEGALRLRDVKAILLCYSLNTAGIFGF